jgi:hypothetical protein
VLYRCIQEYLATRLARRARTKASPGADAEVTTLPKTSPTAARLSGNDHANASRSAVMPFDPPVK